MLQCLSVSTLCDTWSVTNVIRFVFIRVFYYRFIPLQQLETATEKCVVHRAANDLKSFNRSIETISTLIKFVLVSVCGFLMAVAMTISFIQQKPV